MTQTRLLFILAFFVLTAFRCSEEEPMPPVESPAPVSSVHIPATVTVGEPIRIEITYLVNNSCGQFDRLTSEDNGADNMTFYVYSKNEGTSCQGTVMELTTDYSFTPSRKGIHNFRFWQAPEQFLIKTFEVQ
jgi:hypothetical protein